MGLKNTASPTILVRAAEPGGNKHHPGPRAIPRERNCLHGAGYSTITKTYSVTHLAVKETARRYSPTAAIAAERDAVNGMPEQITQATLSAQPLGLARTKPCARRRRLCLGLQIAFGRLA